MPLDDKQRQFLGRGLALTRDSEMNCDEFTRELAALLDGGLDEERRAVVEHHRKMCPECEEELQLLLTGLGRSLD